MISVVWLIQARDQLQAALSDVGVTEDNVEQEREALNETLRKTFPQAEAVAVLQRLGGYSTKKGKHVLQVEVQEKGRVYARMVKFASPQDLKTEWNGWKSCAQTMTERGRAFMTLTKPSNQAKEKLESLIYEDAHHTLRAANVVTLEKAVLNCCRWDTPSISSILMTVDQVFAELLDRLYVRSWSVSGDPRQQVELVQLINEGERRWKDHKSLAGECRDAVRDEIGQNGKPFIDLMTFVEHISKHVSHLPEMRRGPIHGDLHGRNVLVGLVDGEARWPAIFDYEDMEADGFMCWDFVKLEVELKIRVLQCLIQSGTQDFIGKVYAFETTLIEKTEDLNNQDFNVWQKRYDLSNSSTPEEERLRTLILEIRRQAKKCLDVATGRGRRWLHEYYFFLACYGAYSARFPTYDARRLLVAYVSACCAATRYTWAVARAQFGPENAEHQADHAIRSDNPKFVLVVPELIGHEAELGFASKFVRCGKKDFVTEGISLLEELRKKYSSIPEIVLELALGHLENFDLTGDASSEKKAHELLNAFEADQQGLYSTDTEYICRWAGMWKDRGDRAFDSASMDHVGEQDYESNNTPEIWYRGAFNYYHRAYKASGDYHPGINVATLHLLLGDELSSRKVAEEIRDNILASIKYFDQKQNKGKDAPKQPNDMIRRFAALGEAYLLLRDCENARKYYRRALEHNQCNRDAQEAMQKQVRRILKQIGGEAETFDDVLS